MFDNLTHANVALYEAKYYDNPHCTTEDEYLEDINRIKYLKILFNRYRTKKILKDRLIMNHLIILFNVLEPQACTRILFLKINKSDWSCLKPFLLYLNYLPDVVEPIDGKRIITNEIPLDQGIIDILRDFK